MIFSGLSFNVGMLFGLCLGQVREIFQESGVSVALGVVVAILLLLFFYKRLGLKEVLMDMFDKDEGGIGR